MVVSASMKSPRIAQFDGVAGRLMDSSISQYSLVAVVVGALVDSPRSRVLRRTTRGW